MTPSSFSPAPTTPPSPLWRLGAISSSQWCGGQEDSHAAPLKQKGGGGGVIAVIIIITKYIIKRRGEGGGRGGVVTHPSTHAQKAVEDARKGLKTAPFQWRADGEGLMRGLAKEPG